MKNFVIPILVTAVFVVAMTFMAMTPPVTVCELPAIALGELAGYTSEALEPSEAELHSLPSDTRFDKRRYVAANGLWFQVSVVMGGTNKRSIHRPELCLPSQGYLMISPRTVSVDDFDWRYLTLDGSSRAPTVNFAYTFFNQAGFRTSSHTRRVLQDVWDRSILNRIDRWVMITVATSSTDDQVLSDFLRQLQEVIP